MDQALIELEGIGLTLPSQAGDVEILRGIDLTVARGKRVGIVGPSGSGKSSLLMIIGGMERASAGVARVVGADETFEKKGKRHLPVAVGEFLDQLPRHAP